MPHLAQIAPVYGLPKLDSLARRCQIYNKISENGFRKRYKNIPEVIYTVTVVVRLQIQQLLQTSGMLAHIILLNKSTL